MHIGWTHVAELPPVDPSVPAIELTTRKIVPAEGDANRAGCGIECCHICRAHPTNGFGMAAPATGTRESGLRLRDTVPGLILALMPYLGVQTRGAPNKSSRYSNGLGRCRSASFPP